MNICGIFVCTVISVILADYVYYPEIQRHCIRFYNCPPGYGIQPCLQEHQEDLCTKCAEGMVQSEYISSTGNYTTTDCFEPSSECIADDVTYRRFPVKAFCEQMSGCKCSTRDCFYGDPCLCKRAKDKCGVGQELNDIGVCVNCKIGYEKTSVGCGPCLKSDQSDVLISYVTPTSNATIFSYSTSIKTVIYDPRVDTVMITILVILGLVVIVLVIMIVILSRKRNVTKCGIFYCCNETDDGVMEIHQIHFEQQQRQPMIVEQHQLPHDHIIKLDHMEERNKNLNSSEQIKYAYPPVNLNSFIEIPRESVSSGFHDDDNIDFDTSICKSTELCSADNKTEISSIYHSDEQIFTDDVISEEKLAPSLNVEVIESSQIGVPYLSDNQRPIATESEPNVHHANVSNPYSPFSQVGNESYITTYSTDVLSSALEEHDFVIKGLQNHG